MDQTSRIESQTNISRMMLHNDNETIAAFVDDQRDFTKLRHDQHPDFDNMINQVVKFTCFDQID